MAIKLYATSERAGELRYLPRWATFVRGQSVRYSPIQRLKVAWHARKVANLLEGDITNVDLAQSHYANHPLYGHNVQRLRDLGIRGLELTGKGRSTEIEEDGYGNPENLPLLPFLAAAFFRQEAPHERGIGNIMPSVLATGPDGVSKPKPLLEALQAHAKEVNVFTLTSLPAGIGAGGVPSLSQGWEGTYAAAGFVRKAGNPKDRGVPRLGEVHTWRGLTDSHPRGKPGGEVKAGGVFKDERTPFSFFAFASQGLESFVKLGLRFVFDLVCITKRRIYKEIKGKGEADPPYDVYFGKSFFYVDVFGRIMVGFKTLEQALKDKKAPEFLLLTLPKDPARAEQKIPRAVMIAEDGKVKYVMPPNTLAAHQSKLRIISAAVKRACGAWGKNMGERYAALEEDPNLTPEDLELAKQMLAETGVRRRVIEARLGDPARWEDFFEEAPLSGNQAYNLHFRPEAKTLIENSSLDEAEKKFLQKKLEKTRKVMEMYDQTDLVDQFEIREIVPGAFIASNQFMQRLNTELAKLEEKWGKLLGQQKVALALCAHNNAYNMDLVYTAMSTSDLDGFVSKYPELVQQGLGKFLGEFYDVVRDIVFAGGKIYSANLNGETRIFSFDGRADGPVVPDGGVAENSWRQMLAYALSYGGRHGNRDDWAHFRDVLGIPQRPLVRKNSSFSRGFPFSRRAWALLKHWWMRDLIMYGSVSGSRVLPKGPTALFDTAVDATRATTYPGMLLGTDSVATIDHRIPDKPDGWVAMYSYHGHPNMMDYAPAPIGGTDRYYTTLLAAGFISGETAGLTPVVFGAESNPVTQKDLRAQLATPLAVSNVVPQQARLSELVGKILAAALGRKRGG